jgi:hypothetical protein
VCVSTMGGGWWCLNVCASNLTSAPRRPHTCSSSSTATPTPTSSTLKDPDSSSPPAAIPSSNRDRWRPLHQYSDLCSHPLPVSCKVPCSNLPADTPFSWPVAFCSFGMLQHRAPSGFCVWNEFAKLMPTANHSASRLCLYPCGCSAMCVECV